MFYESGTERGGRKAVFATARITRSTLVVKDQVENDLLKRGVVEPGSLKKMGKTKKLVATNFDNIMYLKEPVPFSELTKIGCVGKMNLQTATQVTGKQVITILRRGQAHA